MSPRISEIDVVTVAQVLCSVLAERGVSFPADKLHKIAKYWLEHAAWDIEAWEKERKERSAEDP